MQNNNVLSIHVNIDLIVKRFYPSFAQRPRKSSRPTRLCSPTWTAGATCGWCTLHSSILPR